jgi:hypothetical protein
MMLRAALSAAALISVASGCVDQAGQGGRDASASLVTMPPRGKVSATELTADFAKHCLAYFPDQKKTIEAMRRSDFNTVKFNYEYAPYGEFTDTKRGIEATLDTISMDGSPDTTECRFYAEVSDPEADWQSIVPTVLAQTAEITWEKPRTGHGYRTLSGSYKAGGKALRVYVILPALTNKASLPDGACGDLDDCLGWDAASIVVAD